MAAIIMETAKLRKCMTIDNFDLIEENLKFESNDDFYFLQVIQRKKDGNVTGRGNNGARLIKAYYIHSIDYLEEKKQKIIELCQSNNARAYIHLNKEVTSRQHVELKRNLQGCLWKEIPFKLREFGTMFVENFLHKVEEIC